MTKKGLLRKGAIPAALALSAAFAITGIGVSFAAGGLSASAEAAASETALFTSDYDSREEVLQATLELNDQIADEGMVLVKNENEALPITNTKPRVSVFGYASTNVRVGASNESGDTSAGEAKAETDLYSSLEDAGFVVNPVTKSFYENSNASDDNEIRGNGSWDSALKSLEYSYHSYSDAAIVNLSVTGSGDSRHTRDYDDAQKELVEYLGTKFDKVILLVNNSYPFELGWAEDADYVDAILIVGQPGNNGFNAVGRILSGEVNPSGHLADLYAADFTVTPSFNNFNDSNAAEDMVQFVDGNGDQLGITYVYQYEEGIYIGYRYYETMATLSGITVGNVEEGQPMDGEEWYQAHVVYPFGYGLSYTDFEYSDVKISGDITANGKITASIKVTNVGDYAGKDVIQLYYSAPYTPGGVEKSAVVLGDYAKTDLLEPGESQRVTITMSAADMASYDYNLNSGVGGYVLEKGDYTISLRSDSHTVIEDINASKAQATLALQDDITSGLNIDTEGNDVTNKFSSVTDEVLGEGTLAFNSELSRTSMATQTTTAIEGNLQLTEDEIEEWEYGMRLRTTGEDDVLYTYWADKDNPEFDGNGPADEAERDATASVVAADLIGKAYDDALWDDLLDELSIDELQRLFTQGGYGTIALDYIKLPGTHNMDGPYGWTSSSSRSSWDGLVLGTEQFPLFCSEVMVACTFNKELAYEEGKMIGEQGLWGNASSGGTANAWTGYYSPGMNIHRSPFDSRGTEYYSEDPVLMGYMAANVSLGAQEKGTFVTLKHFAVFNDGTSAYRSVRNTPLPSGTSMWMTEQTLREIYLKCFEIGVKTGSPTGIMSSFAKIGYTYCGVDYALLTEVLRNEWGFNGIVVSDIVRYANQDGEQMVLAGNNLALVTSGTTWEDFNEDGTLDVSGGGGAINILYEYIHNKGASDFNEAFEMYYADEPYMATALYNALREGAHGIIYTIVNSNAMQVPYGATVNYTGSSVAIGGLTENASGSISLGGAELSTVDNYTYGSMYSTITYSVSSGALPTGMTLDSETGVLSGTPTAAGTYTFTVTASAPGYESASVEYTVTVGDDNSAIIDAINEVSDSIDLPDTNANVDLTGVESSITSVQDSVNGAKSAAVAATVFGVLAFVASGAAVALVIIKGRKE